MIRVITAANRERFAVSLDQFFRLRREVFVLERGWSALDKGVHEYDQYDNELAVYLVSMGPGERVVGGCRLYPTSVPHMLSEVFSHTVEDAVISRPDVVELTRLMLAKPHRTSRNYCELFLGLLEYGLQEGLSGMTALMRTLRIPVVQTIGLKVRPLGAPVEIDQESQTPVLIEIDEDSLSRAQRTAQRRESVLEHARSRRASAS